MSAWPAPDFVHVAAPWPAPNPATRVDSGCPWPAPVLASSWVPAVAPGAPTGDGRRPVLRPLTIALGTAMVAIAAFGALFFAI